MATREPRIERLKIGNYTLSTDQTMNWILTETSKSRGHKSHGKEVTRTVGYYPKLEVCLNRMLELKMMKADTKDVQSLISAIGRAKNEIKTALNLLDNNCPLA